MLSFIARGALGAAACLAAAGPALAHVTLDTTQAPAGASYKGVARVPHGCNGQPTTTLRIAIPAGLLDVKPMAKSGWTIRVEQQKYAKPFVLNGKEILAGVSEIVWSGGSLPDDQFDDFVFMGRIARELEGRTIAFPVVQECGSASVRWTDVAKPGEEEAALASPAPTVKVGAAAGGSIAAVGALRIENPWARATPNGAKVGGGYLKIVNTGTEPDRLVGGTVPVAGRLEVHEMSTADGVMRMRPVDKLEIPAGGSVELKPGGYHAMFLDLKEPLKEGDRIKGTLLFEKAGPVTIEYVVRGIAAQSAAAGGEHVH
jgi:copper(I)-binding protein